MKKLIFSVCLLGATLVTKAQWTFQFKFTTTNGLNYTTTPYTTTGFNEGYHCLGTIDMTSYLCEGDQFKLENFSSGSYNCLSGADVINSSTIWDAAFGQITDPPSTAPEFHTIGSYLLNDQVWPPSTSGLMVTVPVGASAPLISDPNNNPNYVYYVLAVAPGMGCNYFGLNNGNASCSTMLFFYIKVKRAPLPLPDLTVCPGTTITNSLLGIPSGVTASNWIANDPTVVMPTATTNYTVTLSNGNSCSITDKVKITVNNPILELLPSASTTLCPAQLPLTGADVYSYGYIITVNGVEVYNTNTSYENPAYVNSNGNFQITTYGTFNISYEYYNANFSSTCTKTYTVFVPKPPKLLVQNITLCSNNFSQVCAPIGTSGITYTYQWFYSDPVQQQSVLVSHNQCFTPNAFGTYTMFMTNQYGCTYHNTYNITLSPSANPNANFIYSKTVNTQVTYTATPSALNSYNKWELILSNSAGVETSTLQTIYTSGMSAASFSPRPVNQYYKIRHTVSNTPCNVLATKAFLDYASPLPGKALRTITVSSEDAATEASFNVFPNPSNGVFTVDVSNLEAGTLEVYDMTGRKVYSATTEASQDQRIDLTGYSKGIYMLNFSGSNTSFSKRIVLE